MRNVLVLSVLALAACGGGSGGPVEVKPREHGLNLAVTNNGQKAMATYTLPQTITVTASDIFDNSPVSGVVLDFLANGNGVFNGTVSQDSVRLTTDASGKVSLTWRLGRAVGNQGVTMRIVSTPLAVLRSPTGVSADVVAGAPALTADAETPLFFNSNISYEWNPEIGDRIHVNIPADVGYPLSNVALNMVHADSSVVSGLTYSVGAVEWRGESKGTSIPVPTCTVVNGVLTCGHGCVGTLSLPGEGGAINLTKPYRMGTFFVKLTITSPEGQALHHVANELNHSYSTGFIWLEVGTFDCVAG